MYTKRLAPSSTCSGDAPANNNIVLSLKSKVNAPQETQLLLTNCKMIA